MIDTGHVVEEFKIGNTLIRICDDYCRDKTQDEIDAILRRITRNALDALSASAAECSGADG